MYYYFFNFSNKFNKLKKNLIDSELQLEYKITKNK